MQASGYRNDTPMTLAPVAVALAVGVVFFCGLEAVNQLAARSRPAGAAAHTRAALVEEG